MAGRRRGGFSFDLFQPIKKGVLLKQGAVHTAFKYRFFVLYPGFFVYYEKESKWRQDLTKGETLDVSESLVNRPCSHISTTDMLRILVLKIFVFGSIDNTASVTL